MTTHKEALTLALEALSPWSGENANHTEQYAAYHAIKEALAQPEQPKVRTGDCLLVGVCASEGHKIQKAQPEQEPVARLHITETDTYPDVDVEVLDGAMLQFSMSPVNVYTTPPQRKPSKEHALYETFAKIAAYLEIDTEAAQSAAGKPSDVFIEAIKKREAPQRKPLTDELVLAGARALAKRHADSCGLDFDDVWKFYADEHKDDARAVIEAANGIKGDA